VQTLRSRLRSRLRLLPLATLVLVAATYVLPVRADLIPSEVQDCAGKSPGAACGGQGTCQSRICSRRDYAHWDRKDSDGPPSISYTCTACVGGTDRRRHAVPPNYRGSADSGSAGRGSTDVGSARGGAAGTTKSGRADGASDADTPDTSAANGPEAKDDSGGSLGAAMAAGGLTVACLAATTALVARRRRRRG
jgi:hypothetical protein